MWLYATVGLHPPQRNPRTADGSVLSMMSSGPPRAASRRRRVRSSVERGRALWYGPCVNISSRPSFRSISPSQALALVEQDAVRVLDVRTRAEFRDLGHIHGAILLPVDLVPAAPATLPKEGKPLLVCCEHGVRSAHAAGFLAQAGFPE